MVDREKTIPPFVLPQGAINGQQMRDMYLTAIDVFTGDATCHFSDQSLAENRIHFASTRINTEKKTRVADNKKERNSRRLSLLSFLETMM